MREIQNENEFKEWVDKATDPVAIQGLDLRHFTKEISKATFSSCLFLGCTLAPEATVRIVSTGGTVIPNNDKFKFTAHRKELYTVQDLFGEYDGKDIDGYFKTPDYQIYLEYNRQGKRDNKIDVSLHRRLHDHSITDALNEVLKNRRVVAVMGGHSMERRDPFYKKTAALSRKLTQDGFLMVSGGGPGAMEATHLGAYFATREEHELFEAIDAFKQRPDGAKKDKEYEDRDWLQRAWKIREAYPMAEADKEACMSVGIPTWLYGHEPPAPFATHIAKYFANSVREDGLLMIANHGIVFVPGSAGTTQEIFQDAAQNHYGTDDYYRPMILMGKEYWWLERPVWPLLRQVSLKKKYGELVALTDDETEIRSLLKSYDESKYKKEE